MENEPALSNSPPPKPPSPMAPQWTTVLSNVAESNSCFTLRMAPHYNDQRPQPGQFNMLYVFGVGEVPISVSRWEKDGEITVHTIRDVGAVTHKLRTLKAGDQVGLRGPFGTVWPISRQQKKDIVIFAGGIGLAPVRPILDTITNDRQQFGRVNLYYGSRTPDEVLFDLDLENWQQNHHIHVQVAVDAADRQWTGHVGFVTDLLKKEDFTASQAVAFICGPEIMMSNASRLLVQRGVAPESIYVSMERNMKCAIGWCGHCQYGSHFMCKDGPVFTYAQVREHLTWREF